MEEKRKYDEINETFKGNSNFTDHLSIKDVLKYEVYSHVLTKWIGFSWGMKLFAWYLARKVAIKHKRYLKNI